MSDPSRALARLLAGPAAQQKRQDRQQYATRVLTGTVTDWDPGDGYSVTTGGAALSGLPALAATVMQQGEAVILLQYKSSLLVAGPAVTGPLAGLYSRNGPEITYGPSGDDTGATDTAAINGWLGAGYTVRLLPGLYYISAPITAPDARALTGPYRAMGIPTGNYGNGPLPLGGAIIQAVPAFSGTAMIMLGATDGAQHGGQVIQAVTLDGSQLPNGNTVHGIYSQGYVGGVTLRDVLVWGGYHTGTGGLGGNGLYATDDGTAGRNPDFWGADHCKFSDCGTWGVSILGLADSWFSDCESTGNGTGGGWSITDGADTRWTGCRADSNGSVPGFSINCGGAQNLQFANCEANLDGTGWVFTGSGSAKIRLSNCIASGNTTAPYSYSGSNIVSTTGCDFDVWIALTPASGWANSGSGPAAQYRWDGTTIEVIADMTAGTLTAGTPVFTLPALAHAQNLTLQDITTRSAQAQLNCGAGGSVTFFQAIGTVAASDRCFVHGRLSTSA